jgi:ankyrin repeat protein
MLQLRALDINWVQPESGCTAAYAATQEGNHQCLALLMKHSDLTKMPNAKWTILHSACQNGTYTCLQMLLEAGLGVNLRTADGHNFTALIVACVNDHVKCISILADRGAHLDLADSYGQTAAHWACKHGHWRSLLLLIRRGADINKREYETNDSPLDFARAYRHPACVDLLLSNGGVSDDSEGIAPMDLQVI